MDVLGLLKQKRIFFDGGTGTYLQSKGLKPGEKPESWCIERPDIIEGLHRAYFDAGANIVKANTFGINKDKFENYKELIDAALTLAIRAKDGKSERYVALDIGPTGRMLEPFGDLKFEDCVELFAKTVRAAEGRGADLILIETMNDALETKAAVIAAKENSSLPVFVTNVYDATGKLMTGATPEAMIAMLEGLGVDALGMNCSLGPDRMLDIIDKFREYSSLPVIVNPNAGLPELRDGKTIFTLGAEDFASTMAELAKRGATIVGGCCGTTPEYIAKLTEKLRDIPYTLPEEKNITLVSSYTHSVEIGAKPILIGERINPTGKKKLKEAIKTGDMDYILSEGVRQADAGVHVLDVNVGVPGIDEAEVMKKTVIALQSVTDKPLQLDSSDCDALEAAMRVYAGKPMVNSVNGKRESMDSVLPLVAKYGGVLIALTLDEDGIPESAEKRAEIAYKIIDEASKYGIELKDIVVDPLALTVSSDPKGAMVTMETIEILTSKGINTSLGVSNVSFGLPSREIINSTFFAQCLNKGLKCAIMNPFSEGMANAYYAHNVLCGIDENCLEYIGYADGKAEVGKAPLSQMSLGDAVIKGLCDVAAGICKEEIALREPMDIINNTLIPALNKVGEYFEKGKVYLPQLLMSADAASAAFDVVKGALGKKETGDEAPIILATVKGDIHDIGKHIVKVVLESYGFGVLDLGRDTEPATVCEAIEKTGARLVGLSALMTTTVPAMEETIKLVSKAYPDVKVMVGGAVLTEEYASVIGADYYGADAMEAARIAKEVYGRK